MNILSFIYISDKTIGEMYTEITVIYDATKFIFTAFFVVITLLISIISVITFTGIKNALNNFIEKERSKLISNMLDDLAKTKQVFGKEYLNDTKLENGIYKFPAIDYKVSFHPNLINKIILKPLEGQKLLKYSAWIKKGQMYIKSENFNANEDKGVDWVIIYHPKYK